MRSKIILAGLLLCMMATASGCIEVHIGDTKQTTTVTNITIPEVSSSAAETTTQSVPLDIFNDTGTTTAARQSPASTDIRSLYNMPQETYDQTVPLKDPTTVMRKTKAKLAESDIGASLQMLDTDGKMLLYTQTIKSSTGASVLRIGAKGVVGCEMALPNGTIYFIDETNKVYSDVTATVSSTTKQELENATAFDTDIVFDEQEAIICYVAGVRYVKLVGHNSNGAGSDNIYYFNVDTGLLEGILTINNSSVTTCAIQYLEDPPYSVFDIPSDFKELSVDEIESHMKAWRNAFSSL